MNISINTNDNIFMKSTFAIINKILRYIDKSLDDDVFDEKNFNASHFEISENRFARLLGSLIESEYVDGLKVVDNGEPTPFDTNYHRFDVIIKNPTLTMKSFEFLAKNTLIAKVYTTAKNINDFIP